MDNIDFDFDTFGGADQVVDKSKIEVKPSTKEADARAKAAQKSAETEKPKEPEKTQTTTRKTQTTPSSKTGRTRRR
jgi:hypothetical protein